MHLQEILFTPLSKTRIYTCHGLVHLDLSETYVIKHITPIVLMDAHVCYEDTIHKTNLSKRNSLWFSYQAIQC